MYCNFCGGRNTEDAANCAHCGQSLRPNAPAAPQPLTGETTQEIPPPIIQQGAPPILQQSAPPPAGASYACLACGYVLAPLDTACARCRTPRGMGAAPYATPPPGGGYAPGGYAPWAQSAPVPTDPRGWSPANIGPILTRPVAFFQAQRGQTDLVQPLLFSALLAFVSMLVAVPLTMLEPQSRNVPGAGVITPIVMLVLAPVLALVGSAGNLVGAAILHLFCAMFGAQGGYQGTFRALVYAQAPSTVFSLFGSLVHLAGREAAPVATILQVIGSIWWFAVLVIGLREIHYMTTGAAFGAAILPVFLCLAALLGIGAVIGFAAWNAFPQQPGAPSGGFSLGLLAHFPFNGG